MTLGPPVRLIPLTLGEERGGGRVSTLADFFTLVKRSYTVYAPNEVKWQVILILLKAANVSTI